MQINDIKQRIDGIEEAADEAKRAAKAAPGQLQQSVEALHQQARQAQQACSSGSSQQQGDASQLRDPVMQLEQAADRALQACKQAGNVDPQLKQAIERTHQQASQLKKQLQMG
ncbi:hypothetical protein [Ramlibacter sp. PS4R-6]|uniref:hypothetical protein n=1 Tax=Ramlibacter sp. PS4R-6 TaxID=3133438 RepID=UPI00309F58DC